MAQIKFYRGGQNTSLPNARRDGAIYIKQTGADEGEIWIDLDSQTRIKAGGGKNKVYRDTIANWNNQSTLISEDGGIYIYEGVDSSVINGTSIPGVKIGDGSSYLIDLPFLTLGVTTSDRNFWNNKIDCYAVAEDVNDAESDRTLFFTRRYMGPGYADEIVPIEVN